MKIDLHIDTDNRSAVDLQPIIDTAITLGQQIKTNHTVTTSPDEYGNGIYQTPDGELLVKWQMADHDDESWANIRDAIRHGETTWVADSEADELWGVKTVPLQFIGPLDTTSTAADE